METFPTTILRNLSLINGKRANHCYRSLRKWRQPLSSARCTIIIYLKVVFRYKAAR